MPATELPIDAHEQLEKWEDAYNERCALDCEQDEEVQMRQLDELAAKLDLADSGKCCECGKELDPEDGADDTMCLSCRCNVDSGE